MLGIAAFIASGCYGMAYMLPKPYCYIALAISTLLVLAMRAGL